VHDKNNNFMHIKLVQDVVLFKPQAKTFGRTTLKPHIISKQIMRQLLVKHGFHKK
jgi:hypothetical protein